MPESQGVTRILVSRVFVLKMNTKSCKEKFGRGGSWTPGEMASTSRQLPQKIESSKNLLPLANSQPPKAKNQIKKLVVLCQG